MTTLYIESSALISVLLENDFGIAAHIRSASTRTASKLTVLETRRGLDRARRTRRITDQDHKIAVRKLRAFRNRSLILEIDDQTLQVAEQEFPVEPVRSLDAIHLASALIWSGKVGPITVASHDRRIRANATALGLPVVP